MLTEEAQERKRAYGRAYMKIYCITHADKRLAYRNSHKEQKAKRAKAHREENRETINAKKRIFNASHTAERAEYKKAWRATHKEDISAYEDSHKEEFRAYRKSYELANRDSRKDKQLQHRHGISLKNFNEILGEQGGACAICGRTEWNGTGPHVDHDHGTGKIRGILCHNCNVSLGLLRDNPAVVRAMVAYLEKNA